MSRPKIFIGSSIEGLDVASAVHENLDHFADVTIWNQNHFELSRVVITSLVNSLGKFEFAIFIFSPDDITNLRGKNVSTVRDNVIFETGLFAGGLGIDKVFILKPRNQADLHLPTDLSGLVTGQYNSDREDRNLTAATGPFCNQVKQLISEAIKEKKAEKQKTPEQEKTLEQEQVLEKKSDRFENDLQIIISYLKDKNKKTINFQKLGENVHPKFTENYVMGLIERFPMKIRRVRFTNGAFGVKLLDRNI